MAAPAQGREPRRVASGLLRRSAGVGRRGCKTGSAAHAGKARRLNEMFSGVTSLYFSRRHPLMTVIRAPSCRSWPTTREPSCMAIHSGVPTKAEPRYALRKGDYFGDCRAITRSTVIFVRHPKSHGPGAPVPRPTWRPWPCPGRSLRRRNSGQSIMLKALPNAKVLLAGQGV